MSTTASYLSLRITTLMEMYRALSILLLLHVVFINFTHGQHYYNRSMTEMLPILTKPDFFLIGAMKVAYITIITTIIIINLNNYHQ